MPFWNKCSEFYEFKMTLNATRSNYFYICSTSTLESKLLLYNQPFSSYMPLYDKSTKWPQNDNLKTKRHSMHILLPESPKFQSALLYAQPFFKLQAILGQLHQNEPNITFIITR